MDILHAVLLTLHSITRWLVVLFGLLAIIRSINGLAFKRGYTQTDNRVSMLFTTFMDVQLLLGLILFYLYTSGFQNMAEVMGNPGTRFFGAEHTAMMFIAVVVAHIGRALVRKAPEAAQKHRRTIIWFVITFIIVLIAIPWPGLPYGRPLLRFGL